MLLVEITINAVLHYVSLDGEALTNYWDAYIKSVTAPQNKLRKIYGGYIEPSFGGIVFSRELFTNDWPPPVYCPIKVKYSDTTQEDAETLLFGTAHLKSIDTKGITYDLYGGSYDTTIASNGTATFATSLIGLFEWATHASRLNMYLDTSLARSPSPTIQDIQTQERVLLDYLSDVSAPNTHMFTITASGSTLQLIDMFATNGSRAITEFEYFPSKYRYEVPVATITGGTSDFQRELTSLYPWGKEMSVGAIYATQATLIDTAISNILSIVHRPQAELILPLEGDVPHPGEKVTWIDSSLASTNTEFNMWVRTVQFDLSKHKVILKGDGAISATSATL